jgi:hypothetical protein
MTTTKVAWGPSQMYAAGIQITLSSCLIFARLILARLILALLILSRRILALRLPRRYIARAIRSAPGTLTAGCACAGIDI